MSAEVMASTSPCSLSRKENSVSPSACSETDEVYLNAPEYMTDEFRMKHFKIDKCPRLHAHDWTTCPLAHDGEKARRRNPEEFKYAAIACIDMKNNGHCPRGDSCPYAHNVFEYWMHPTRYRTQVCNDGTKCKRQICFFAHRLEELRIPPRKPGFPPEWNKGRKHKNRSANSKKKTSAPRNDIGRQGSSEPVVEVSSGPRRPASQAHMMKEPSSSAVNDGSLHHLMLGNVMQNAGSLRQQHDAAVYQPVSSAVRHNICNQFPKYNRPAADRQHRAGQSDSQTSRDLGYYATTLEKALCSTGIDYCVRRKQEHATDNGELITAPRGELLGLGRMNADLFLNATHGLDVHSASISIGSSSLTSPEASLIRSPQNAGPFPGMGSDLGSPLTPSSTEQQHSSSSAKLGYTAFHADFHYNQRSLVPDHHQQPFAY